MKTAITKVDEFVVKATAFGTEQGNIDESLDKEMISLAIAGKGLRMLSREEFNLAKTRYAVGATDEEGFFTTVKLPDGGKHLVAFGRSVQITGGNKTWRRIAYALQRFCAD